MWEWQVRHDRPRIWLDGPRLAWLREKAKGKTLAEVKQLTGVGPEDCALAYILTGDEQTGREAVRWAIDNLRRFGPTTLWRIAVVYDWCHGLLTDDEKAAVGEAMVREGLKRIANRRLWRSFNYTLYKHAADVGIAALALCHSDPFGQYALDFIKTRCRDAMDVFENLFPDGEWPEGYDFNRVATGMALRFFWALKTATGDDLMAGSRHVKNTSMYLIYCHKPNGLIHAGGDVDWPLLNDRDRETLLYLAAEFRDPYAQYVLNHCPVRTFSGTVFRVWLDLLWYDAAIPEKPLEDLPLSRIFRGQGLVAARSGWGWDQDGGRLPISWLTFKCGKYYGQQCHYDNNHFDIYYRGELAIDSGRPDDDWGLERNPKLVHRSQYFNYYRRAIAHNTVIVHDPDEQMEMGVANDGGQRELLVAGGVRNDPEYYDLALRSADDEQPSLTWTGGGERWDTGAITAYMGNNLFTYACGDATKSYSAHKLRQFTRHFLFVQPNVVVIYDKVVSAAAGFRKTWLLHSILEPTLNEDGSFEVAYAGGRLVCAPLLPERRRVKKVGGPGSEFLVGGVHYACGPNASSGRKTNFNFGETPGAWRVEQSPWSPAEEDHFLNVMFLTDKHSTAQYSARLTAAAGGYEVTASAPGGRVVTASFAVVGATRVNVRIEEFGRTLLDAAMPTEIILEKGRI